MTQNLLSQLREMDPYEFEHLIADLWEEMGFQTEVIQQSRDNGIDVRATNQLGQKHLIQVKRHGPNSVVGDPKIREYAGLYRQENGVDEVYVVTTNGFTSQAIDTADSVGVELVDDERLITFIAQNDENQILSGHLAKSKPGSNSDSGGLQSIASSDNETNTATTGSRHSIPNSQTVTPADIEPGATLRGEDLSDATLTGANLSDADLSYADLSDANLKRAELSGAKLTNADLTEMDLSNADLSNVDLSGANLTDTALPDSLVGATFRGTELTDIDLSGTNISIIKSLLSKCSHRSFLQT